MKPFLTRLTPDLPAPDSELVSRALTAARGGEKTRHDAFAAQVEALRALEQREPGEPAPWPGKVTVAAFNAERLKSVEPVRNLLDRIGARIALLSEVDVGMARSANRHGPRALTQTSGEGFVYGVEFVELGLGDRHELREHAGAQNSHGLHGNAIVTALRLVEPHVIPLEEGGSWFPGYDGVQHRLGGRMAVAARVQDAPRPLWLVSVHLESKSDAQHRAAQVARLLAALEELAPRAAVVIGGDFNTKALPEGDAPSALASPERWEPLFRAAGAAGFDWRRSNLPLATQRTGPSGEPGPPFRKIDWLFTRGVDAESPRVIEALDDTGRPLSDHEMLAVEIAL